MSTAITGDQTKAARFPKPIVIPLIRDQVVTPEAVAAKVADAVGTAASAAQSLTAGNAPSDASASETKRESDAAQEKQ